MAQKIVIASGKGGVGKTSLCVGIGKALGALGMKVLLIDCDCLRSLDVLTGVTEKMVYNFGDVIFGRCAAADAVYENDGISVVTCPESYDNISDYSMKWLVSKYEKDFDYILLDAPAGIERGLHLALSVADRAIVISTPDLVCVRSACIAGREIEKAGVKTAEYIAAALSPADVISVEPLEDGKSCRVVVPDDQLSLAIGKEGQNARLAAKLTGFKIDIKPASAPVDEVEEEVAAEEAPVEE